MFDSLRCWMTTSAWKYEATLLKKFSIFDKHSDIYSFRIVDDDKPEYFFKVGRMSQPLGKRQAEWDRQCPSRPHIWYNRVPVKHLYCVKRLVHLALMARGMERVESIIKKFFVSQAWMLGRQ
uniref:Uncharacterized protein n=1 Tax=Moniliophthora roreri TaxID=221103 RepID=A0A0W0G1Y3_MONRR